MIEIANVCLTRGRALFVACALAAGCCVLQAQPDGPPPGEMQPSLSHGPSVERELKQLTQLLTLTTEQQTQVKAILTDQHHQIETLFDQSKTTKTGNDGAAGDEQRPSRDAMENMRAAAKSIRDNANAKIAATLTDDQQAKYAAWEKKRQKASARQESDEMPPTPPDGEGGPPPDGGGGAPPGV